MFQSFFYWMWLLRAKMACVAGLSMEVSILLLLDVALEAKMACVAGLSMEVSILLLLDVALEAWAAALPKRSPLLFQSFFYWMWLLRGETLECFPGNTRVSILLLLDVALEGLP